MNTIGMSTLGSSIFEFSSADAKKYKFNMLFRILFLIGLVLFFIACASPNVKKFSYAPTANPTDEIRNLQTEMDRAETEQIAVFAPDSYKEARESLADAKKAQDRGASNAKILDELSEARSYFEKARSVAGKTLAALPEVADARENALIAGAALNHRSQLRDADRKLTNITDDFEKRNPRLSVQQKVDLQKEYLDLELAAIKTNRLGDARSLINGARKQGAERYTPKALARAEGKLRSAELTVNTDRHNDALLTAVAGDATLEAQRLMKTLQIARQGGRPGNEAIAYDLVLRDERIAKLNEQMAMTEEQRRQLASQQQQQESQISTQLTEAQKQAQEAQRRAQEAQKKLEARQRADEIYERAQQMFSPSEAQVYRQGENLILRLKAVNFPSGRSDLPGASFDTLGKVRSMARDMNAQKIIVEGHTDATGSPEINQKVSLERAQAVAEFLRQPDTGLSGGAKGQPQAKADLPEIEAMGYGYEHPIATNKTKQGRAQNRRVDVIITPQLLTE